MRAFRHTAKALIAAVATLALLAAPAAAGTDQASAWTRKANLTLVHGVPGFDADISVYRLGVGSQRFNGVTFGTVAGPLRLDPGIYGVFVRPAGASKYSKPILSKWLWLGSGANKSVVAHLTADGKPAISAYSNNVSALAAGSARVTVRHTAAAPAVDILANGSALISGLTNPNQATRVVPANTAFDIAVRLSGTSTVVPLLNDATFGSKTLTIAYAVGSLKGGSFQVLYQTLPTA
jgi:hypothetical protein